MGSPKIPGFFRFHPGWFLGVAGVIAVYILDNYIDTPFWLAVLTCLILLVSAAIWPWIVKTTGRRKYFWGLLGIYAIGLVAFVVLAKPDARSAVLPEINFTTSPAFTDERKERIAEEIGAFSSYLTRVGFVPLEELPLIGTRPRRGSIIMDEQPGYAYSGAIYLGEYNMDDAPAIRRAFALYYFSVTIGAIGPKATREVINAKTNLSWVYSTYFLGSYINKHELLDEASLTGKWGNVLWDIRAKLGREITDKALFISFAQEGQFPKVKDYESYIRGVLLSGLHAVINDAQGYAEIVLPILSNHGLTQTSE